MASHKHVQPSKRFSDQLEMWLKSEQPKTLGSISQAFGEKGYAVTVLLLMILPALPLPTGGVTHVFEAFTVILSLPLVIGKRSFWIPAFIGRYKLGKLTTGTFLPTILRLVRRIERYSKPRLGNTMQLLPFRIVSGLVIIALAISAALAPPFSGLDTFPSLGVVLITIGIILDDFIIYIIGVVLGIAGIGTVLFLGASAIRFVHHLL